MLKCSFDCALRNGLDFALKKRQDFSHCEANVKSPLDEVLRRGSVSVGRELAW
jgi:hypothetical protein